MKNTFGYAVSVTLFGESHGPEIGAVLDGMAPGIPVDDVFIARQLTLRRPFGEISTARVEADRFRIVSGVYRGKTTGTPICVLIPNENAKSEDYAEAHFLPRPGHADLTGFWKYHGFEDRRGGGHFSGRLTAPLVAVGAVAISALRQKGILIGTHILRCAGMRDRDFGDLVPDIQRLNAEHFAVLDPSAGEEMRSEILAAAKDGDSVGGVLETAVLGLPAGVGEPFFDTLEGVLSHALYSIPGVKGVEFGDGFAIADKRGSQANDPIRFTDGKALPMSCHGGGIFGGISAGSPLLFRLALKPTPSIFKEQETVDLTENTNATLSLRGRHDPAIVHRARVVADSLTALTLCDLLAMRFGTDWLREA